MKNITLTFLILMVSACSYSNDKLIGHADNLESHRSFGVCHGYGCKNYQTTGLTDQEWARVEYIFNGDVKNAEEERMLIAKSIALIEQFIGPKTGTANDKAKAAVISLNTKGQMDCIDEAFNTSSYLYLMRQAGFIKFHTLGKPLRRNFNELSYPHSSATIHEIGKEKIITGDGHFVVDSWFHENGALAEIIPASTWDAPWYPKLKKTRYNFSAS
ncbi:hypothetical protein [Pseudemcibacter aquimaris]|uniref:hypothetical protein n=1 Tax=Pseudemcibacter aquimaris TaxID=2857064 RepID=UPI002011956D|nr:hypothetical protein [Pseudemcibacter aquimaris]MCC3861430.1 hypothetical protein [Pseudemcibacter aquimaris]WDU58199.1 hypothetical protein KW060_13485 [Pseudemcibacter aquimaris]